MYIHERDNWTDFRLGRFAGVAPSGVGLPQARVTLWKVKFVGV